MLCIAATLKVVSIHAPMRLGLLAAGAGESVLSSN